MSLPMPPAGQSHGPDRDRHGIGAGGATQHLARAAAKSRRPWQDGGQRVQLDEQGGIIIQTNKPSGWKTTRRAAARPAKARRRHSRAAAAAVETTLIRIAIRKLPIP